MAIIPPALFVMPHHFKGNRKDIYRAIAIPMETSSRLLSHPHLINFGESDLEPYWQEMLKCMAPLWRIVNRTEPVPHSVWECAYHASQAVQPIYELLESLFTEGDLPSAGYDKRRHLKLTRNRLIGLKGTLAEESLILSLQRALTAEHEKLTAIGSAGQNANLRGRADGKTDTSKKIPRNPDALKLIGKLNSPHNKSRSQIEVAREFCEENNVTSAKPESLLRKIRRSRLGPIRRGHKS